MQGGSRKRQGYGKSQYTVLLAVIEKTREYAGSQKKMMPYCPPLGASEKATQRQLVEFFKTEHLLTVPFTLL